jgi:arylsulfatase A-like enzyme
MRNELSLRVVLVLFAAAAFMVGRGEAAPSAAKPNILFIVADDIGYGDLSCYGNKDIATPNLDALAAGGTRFASGYVMAPVCGPSRAAILSGRYPSHILPYAGNPPRGSETGLPQEHRLMPGFLHDAGYRTAALGKWHLGEQAGYEPQADDLFRRPARGAAGLSRRRPVRGRAVRPDGV